MLRATLRLSNGISNNIKSCFGNIQLSSSIKFNFAKQAPSKDNKKPGGKQQPKVEVIEDPLDKLSPIQKYALYFNANTPTLSPSQRQAINTKFDDLSESDKQLLDILADKILQANTTVFYDFAFKKGGLGTSEAFYVASSNLTQEQIHHGISVLRKDI